MVSKQANLERGSTLGRVRVRVVQAVIAALAWLAAPGATAQTNPPPGSYIRSYVNDIPNAPLISVSVTGAVGVACMSIEEDLPASASPLAISGDGVYLPSINAIRWGPYFDTVATNVSYRITGLPASYPVNGGAWMDGAWYFSPGVTMVNILPANGGAIPTPTQQVATPVISSSLSPPVITNSSFESPTLGSGSYVYYGSMTTAQKTQFAWTAGGNGGNGGPALFSNGSAWGYANVPNGTQGLSLQQSASITQSVYFASPDTYTLSWMAASRSGQVNPYSVQVDGTTLGTFSTANTAWQPFSAALNITNSGYHSISFIGLNPAGGDNSVGLDDLSITSPPVAAFPISVSIISTTPGVTIYYTLDGSLPNSSSLVYAGPFNLTNSAVVRAIAVTNGWTPSVVSVAYYGYSAVTANAQFSRGISGNGSVAPTVTFTVTPGTNANCLAVTETLPVGLAATNVSAGGNYVASNNVVLWGPFFGTNVQTLSYQAVGQPGTYPAQASWSVDGVSGSETMPTNIVIASAAGNSIPTAPPQVAAPAFIPGSGGNVPVSVTITDATPGAVIYYTLDGTLPAQSSMQYTGPVNLASAGVIRAAAFTNGWTPSVATVAYYGPPAATANAQVARSINTGSPTSPIVTFTVAPGATANCVAVTESLPAGVSAINVSSGGNYVASNNVVLWGPFFGTNQQMLSYQAVGLPGTYPVRASWSVDGVGGSEATGSNLVIAGASGGTIPTAPPQVPACVLMPPSASSLPVTVVISNSDSLAQIYYTTDGTLPTQNSALYTGPLTFNTQTTLRAAAFQQGYLSGVAVVGEYVPVQTANSMSLAPSVSDNGSFLPTVYLIATPGSGVNCYAVTETVPNGLTPSGLSGDGVWNPALNQILWGPYLDNQPRVFTFNAGGASGTYQLIGQASFNGYSTMATNSVQINANFSGSGPITNLAACAQDFLTFNLNIDPAPGVVTVTNASGTVNWGDGTQSSITQPAMMLEKTYTAAGNYSIVITANWSGYSGSTPESGVATVTDLVQVVTTCLAPQIVTQPSNEVVLAGSTAQFTVSASSSVPMTYQWYFDTNAQVFSASAFATLSLPNVTPFSAGFYSVLITNAFGSATSQVASLRVVTPLISNIKNANGKMTLNFAGLPNASTRIWATTNLEVPSDWAPIFTNTTTTTNGTWQFIDTNALYRWRFYRFSTP